MLSSVESGEASTGTSTESEPAPVPDRVPLTVQAAASALGIKERAVRKRIAAGTLEAALDGRRWLVYLPAPGGTAERHTAGYLQVPLIGPGPQQDELQYLRRRVEELNQELGELRARYADAQKMLEGPSKPPRRASLWRRLFKG